MDLCSNSSLIVLFLKPPFLKNLTCISELNGFDDILVIIFERSVCFALFLCLENLDASTLHELFMGP